jgi:hypothetical protein
MADSHNGLHVNVIPRESWSGRRRRTALIVAIILCAPVLIRLERSFPGALDLLIALGLVGAAVYVRKLPVRIALAPMWVWYLAAAACFVALAIADARAAL